MIEKKIESLFEDLADTGIAAAVLKGGKVVFVEMSWN